MSVENRYQRTRQVPLNNDYVQHLCLCIAAEILVKTKSERADRVLLEVSYARGHSIAHAYAVALAFSSITMYV